MFLVATLDSTFADAAAILGAVTGVIALWRTLRQGARLHVEFSVFEHNDASIPWSGVGARIVLVNAGTLPAYVSSVQVTTTGGLAWPNRWPVIRSVPSRYRRQWWLRWLLNWASPGTTPYWNLGTRTDPELLGRLEPGEMKVGHLVDIIVNKGPEPMESSRVEALAGRREWLVVETGTRRYAARIFDARPERDAASC